MSGLGSAVAAVPYFIQSGGAHAVFHSTVATEPICGSPSCSSFSAGPTVSPLTPEVFGGASVLEVLAAVISFAGTVSLVALVIIAVVANRADPDPTGRRPQSVYFFIVSFVTITTAISGSALIVASILGLTASHTTSVGHVLIRLLVVSLLLTVVSLGLFTLHIRRGLLLARGDSAPTAPSRRVGQTYVSIVAFVSIMVILVGAVFAIYLLLSLVSPGAFGSFGGRAWTARILIETVYLTAVATYILWSHSSLLSPGLEIMKKTLGGPSTVAFAPADQFQPPPPPPPVPPLS